MLKKKLVLAILLALSGMAARADISLLDDKAVVYGWLATSPEYESIDSTAAGKSTSRLRLADQSSRIGFKGETNLDEDLKAFWRAEQRVRVGASSANGTNDASAGWGDRPTYVGLQNSYGKVVIGKFFDVIDDSRDDFFKCMSNIEETSGGIINFVRRGAGKPTSAMEYASPSMSGFRFKADYDFGSNTTTANSHGVAGSIMYNAKRFDVGYAYKLNSNSSTTSADYSTSTLSDSYNYKYNLVGWNINIMSGLDFSAAIDKVSLKGQTTQVGYGVGMTYVRGKLKVNATYGLLDDTKKSGASQTGTGAWGANLGVTYKMNKNLDWLAGFALVKNEANSAVGTNTVKSLAPDGSTALYGSKITAISTGLRYNF